MARKKSSGSSPPEAKETRTRSWTFVLYDDSAPSDWRDKLDEYHIPWAESPLHDQDVNPDGTPKKVHRHIGIFFDSVKSFDQVKEITEALHCPIPQRCHSERGLIRYMAHLDNPEKAQYKTSDIIGHQGFDVDEYLRPSASLRAEMFKDMLAFSKEQKITAFCDLVDYARINRSDWFDLLANHGSIFLSQYFRSFASSIKKRIDDYVDPTTGEIKTDDK